MTATWGEHEPAYYVATHTESKEVVVAIRGTWAVEDVVTDITALPVVRLHLLAMSPVGSFSELSVYLLVIHVSCCKSHLCGMLPPEGYWSLWLILCVVELLICCSSGVSIACHAHPLACLHAGAVA